MIWTPRRLLEVIRRAVANAHELEVYAAVLAKAREIPKTSSGKTRRSACRQRYLGGQLEVVAQWHANVELEDEARNARSAPCPRLVAAGEAEEWLIQRIAARLGLPPAHVHLKTPFVELGIGSVDAVEIAAELENWLGRRMPPTAIYNYPNIATLAEWLTKPPRDEAPVITPPRQTHIPLGDLNPERLFEDVRNMTDDDIKAFVLQEMAKQCPGE